jgi:chemotaxis protein CheC
MTTEPSHDGSRTAAVDRLCELTSIGAGHAAGALATLLARPIEMSVPRAHGGDPAEELADDLAGDPSAWSGVLFDVTGGPGGSLALLFPPATHEAVLGALLGAEPRDARQAASALSEVGNILISHVVSAIGDTIGEVVLPSTPDLALRDAPAAWARRLRERVSRAGGDGAARVRSWIDVELRDRARNVRARLAYVPELLG